MIIGLLGDSHGRRRTTAAAIAALRDAGAELLIHLGDFEDVAVMDELVGQPARCVLGNCDYPPRQFLDYARHVGVEVNPERIELDAGDIRVVATHGHLQRVLSAAIAAEVDYLIHGHTHELRDDIVGATRVINPGALARARRYTAAVLDTARGKLTVIDLPRDLD